jgi:hypothetical protein
MVTHSPSITPTRLQAKGWARVHPLGAHTLRRGAWYPVVRLSSSNIVVLDVNRRNVPVDRRLLEIRYHPPERWTIVQCDPRMLERVGRVFPLTYAVCPACRNRQGFDSGAQALTCGRCHRAAGLAWDEMGATVRASRAPAYTKNSPSPSDTPPDPSAAQ